MTDTPITVRELPADEWHKLDGHPELSHGLPPPEIANLVVAEQGDKIVGYWLAMTCIHVEPVWVAEDHRNGHVVRNMWRKVKEVLDGYQVPVAFCTAPADRPEVADGLEQLGFEFLPQLTYLYRST